MQEVSDFIVIAPAGQGKAVRYAEQRIIGHLAARFPYYNFRLEAFGPLVDEEDFRVIPIVNRRPEPGEASGDPDLLYMCKPLDPRVIPSILEALREFRIEALAAN